MDKKVIYEISVYDNDNDLHERYEVETEEEKNEVLEKHYYKNKKAKYCTIDRIEVWSDALFKENFGYE